MQSLSRPACFIVLAIAADRGEPLESPPPYITGKQGEYEPSYALLETASKGRS